MNSSYNNNINCQSSCIYKGYFVYGFCGHHLFHKKRSTEWIKIQVSFTACCVESILSYRWHHIWTNFVFIRMSASSAYKIKKIKSIIKLTLCLFVLRYYCIHLSMNRIKLYLKRFLSKRYDCYRRTTFYIIKQQNRPGWVPAIFSSQDR